MVSRKTRTFHEAKHIVTYCFCFKVRQYRDFIALLPDHLALRILAYLSPQELLVAAQVSQVASKTITESMQALSIQKILWAVRFSPVG